MAPRRKVRSIERSKKEKPKVNPGMHYSIMVALVIANLTSLGLAFLMAQFLGMSMGNIAYIGELQSITPVYASTAASLSRTLTPGSTPTPLPQPTPTCDARWGLCSQICDDDYSGGVYTSGGWKRCEKDCDLRLYLCQSTGQWIDDIKVRDTKFKP